MKVMENPEFKCPVCMAKGKLTETCRRCGADLHELLVLNAELRRLKIDAINSIRDGDIRKARETVHRIETISPNRGAETLSEMLELLENESLRN